MEQIATILHADLDAFYASVEQLLDPSLRGKPIAVGGGVVLAASYEARAFGVRGGMPGRKARELCPHLLFVGGNFKEYQRLGDAAIAILDDYTPLVERISIDEAFADVAGTAHLFGPPVAIAQLVRKRVRCVFISARTAASSCSRSTESTAELISCRNHTISVRNKSCVSRNGVSCRMAAICCACSRCFATESPPMIEVEEIA